MTDYHFENATLHDVLNRIEALFNDVSTTGNPHHFAYIGPTRRLTFNCITAEEAIGEKVDLVLDRGLTHAEAKAFVIEHIDSLLSELFDPIVAKFKNHLGDPSVCFVVLNKSLFIYSHELVLLIGQEHGLNDD